ncbi:MAG: hypothetical protein ACOZD0_11825 [Pseudomonadota bacterium]
MFLMRLVALLLLIGAGVCLALFIATGHPRWRRYLVVIVKWTVIAALGLIGVLLLERLTPLL